MLRLLTLAIVAMQLIACTPAVNTVPLAPGAAAPKPESAPIELFYTKAPTRNYTELGIVSARQRNKFISSEALVESLKSQAREMGGDAIIGISTYDKAMGGYISGSSVAIDHDLVLQGTVVKWQ